MSASKWSDLGVRAASALVLAPLTLLVVYQGGICFTIFAITLGLLMAYEWVAIVHSGNIRQFALHALAVVGAGLVFEVSGVWASILVVIIFTIMSSITINSFARSATAWSFLGVPYVALPVLAFQVLRHNDAWGPESIIWCMIIVWSADVLAYFSGRTIGGPKLAPRLSPKKTWAGLAGAVIGAMIASIVFSVIEKIALWPLVGLAAFMALAEQGGDIFESALKRRYEVKDSSDLIPGHGGALDRVDGLITVVFLAALIGFLRNATNPAAGLLFW